MNAQTRLKEDIEMKTIDQLKQEADDLRAKVRKIHETIDKIMSDEALPDLKKKYEGKYFKYRNSCSGDPKWWLYSKCEKVVFRNLFEGFWFQIDYAGRVEIKNNVFEFHFQKEITKKEFMTAYNKMLKTIETYAQGK
jgi:hypothetical protein